MNKDLARQALTLIAAVATIVMNILANALPLNGLNTGVISDRFKVFFVPAGYVFAIWGLIYVGWMLFAIYQALPSQRTNPRLQRIGYWFVLSCAANVAWLFLWHYEQFVWTLAAMFTLLASLIVIYLRLGIGRAPVSTKEKWLVNAPFSIYLGWITVATIANVTSTLDYLQWNGWGIRPDLWAGIMLAVGIGVALLINRTRRDIGYQLVLVWAFAGIAVKHAGTASVASAAWIAVAVVLGSLVTTLAGNLNLRTR